MSLQMTAGLGSWSLPFATAPGIKKLKPGAYLIPFHQPERTMREGHLGAVWQRVGGFAPRFRKPGVENMNAMLGLVAAGEGLAFIPELIFDRFPPCSDWTSRPLRPAKPAFALDAVWNPAHVSHTLSTYLSFFPEPDFASKKVDAPSP